MYGNDFRAPKINIHQFAMIPNANIPRSVFRIMNQHKTTINASNLTPVYVQEVLPGDTFNCNVTAYCRMSTPVYPIMDNMDLEAWFFFVPCRILWQHWVNFMGEQPASPSDSISYTIPTVSSSAAGWTALSLFDYMGLPTQTLTAAQAINALPLRAYNMIWNQWFRDENQNTAAVFGSTGTVYDLGDGPDLLTNYVMRAVNKRHDYFTSALPWTQKGGTAITIPLSGQATVRTAATALVTGTQNGMLIEGIDASSPPSGDYLGTNSSNFAAYGTSTSGGAFVPVKNIYPSNLYADMTTATNATINALRLSFQTQKLLERDARGGTRYTEIVRSHFGVTSPDMRLQRPEYLGGGENPGKHRTSPANHRDRGKRHDIAPRNTISSRHRSRTRDRISILINRTRLHPRPRHGTLRPHLPGGHETTVDALNAVRLLLPRVRNARRTSDPER